MALPTIDTERASDALVDAYRAVRRQSLWLAEPLSPEDQVVQSMPDASPIKWHLAHTTWFFETLVLMPAYPGYEPVNPQFQYLFNSYYNSLGRQFSRPHRGLITRPTVADVQAYRAHVDACMTALLTGEVPGEVPDDVVRVGINHEQQHQELMLTDVKHLLSCNPLYPVYRERQERQERRGRQSGSVAAWQWLEFEGGVREIGFAGDGFAYDNEGPRHRVYLEPFALAERPVTAGEYLEFMADGGYTRAELWLSDGWNAIRERGWRAPLYWEEVDGVWHQFTLAGLRPVDPAEPVCHVSYYEADAYARWVGARLPSEAEWEVAAADVPIAGNLVESTRLHPAPAEQGSGLRQVFGDVWEWTQSAYAPYPGYRPPEGALGEYNAKFMCSQLVLRGGSCATPASHIRPTYRNFFPPDARWQFSGLRLARDGR